MCAAFDGRRPQEELAHSAGIHRTYLCGLERDGNKNPTLDVVGRIAAALNVTVGSLVDE
ncbi:helix-turn-helix domain-containing protein [Rhizorhabdus histidinilytica]|uniref:Helix-turn-helix n=1 Tax=Rhizorhabdus histidinilytica TaxID=439228 RepID=A0A1T5G812_9SPHN|nr:Helix-turn-helix [Rhizorhabdus histidinilytica]